MKISSNFHDYYESAGGGYYGDYPHYIRTPKKLDVKWWFPRAVDWETRYRRNPLPVSVRQHVVGFCGRVYTGFDLQKGYGDEAPRRFCYAIESVDDFLRENLTKKEWETYETIPKEKRKWRLWPRHGLDYPVVLRRVDFLKAFNQYEDSKVYSDHHNLFAEHRTPIFHSEYGDLNAKLGHELITINAPLKPLEFFRKFNPPQAFQEISMFLGNMAMPEKTIPEIDDVTMAEAKGFNKWSFRTPPKK